MKPGYPDEKVVEMIKLSPETREEVFGLLFMDKDLRSKAFKSISRMIKDSTTVEDIFLDGLIQLIKSITRNKYKGQGSLTTYFIGICKILSLRRIDNYKKEKGNFDSYQTEVTSNSEPAQSGDPPLIALEENRYEARLKKRIYKQLSDKCRLYFRQKYGQLMSVKEMSSMNEVKEQSIKNTLSRCYQKVRDLVQKDPEIMAKIQSNYGKF